VIGDEKRYASLVVVAQREMSDKRPLTAREGHRLDELAPTVPFRKYRQLTAPWIGRAVVRAAGE
jgi:hypothetical protein